jgi:adenosine 3'-phospho 5'-phosphosulfate transporter B3
VLIGGILIQGKRYGLLDLIAAILMSLGLIIFTLADSKVSPNFEPRGYVMISLALVADAIIGNVQEKAMKAHNASNEEIVREKCQLDYFIRILPNTVFAGPLFLLHWVCVHFCWHPLDRTIF